MEELYDKDTMYLPPEYRAEELISQYPSLEKNDPKKLQKRLTCDYIAGMMDSYAISTYEKIFWKKI